MQAIDNHWNHGQEYRNQMMAPEYEPEMPKWTDLSWIKKSVIDRDGTTTFSLMTATANGVTYEGTGMFEKGKLITVDCIEISK
jgi:hypothetical protein